jgi:hypothetical protein
VESEIMPVVNVRFNKKELEKLQKVIEFFGVENKWGEKSEAIKKSIDFVLEFKHLFWERFLQDYPPLSRSYIKKRLTEE